MNTSLQKIHLFLGALVLMAIGWGGHSFYISNRLTPIPANGTQVREDSGRYQFINPLLYIENASTTFHELDPLKEKYQETINSYIAQGLADKVSVYYRDLNSGIWTGVGEDELYVPGSILKVATLIVYLKIAEDDPNIFNQELPYDSTKNDDQYYAPQEQLETGNYKVTTLLGHSIIESDNAAYLALSLPIQKELAEFYKTLRIEVPATGPARDFRSPREISRIFRALYSSTYLSESYSEQALELMSKTTFTKGLVAGVAAGTPISHKFGEHSVFYLDPAKTPDYQLHDCGIIYYPSKPYFLCVMTKGKKFENLEQVISGLSKLTYSLVKR
jgi:hypothetical protein